MWQGLSDAVAEAFVQLVDKFKWNFLGGCCCCCHGGLGFQVWCVHVRQGLSDAVAEAFVQLADKGKWL
jgi:hypothetical protein